MHLRSTPLRQLALAAGALSLLRVPLRGDVTPADQRASTAWYPLVGLALAAFPTAALLAPLPDLPRAALALVAWVIVTRALPLRAWAACCDAVSAPLADDETRLAAVEAAPLGAVGVISIVLLLLAKWSALAEVGPAAPLVAIPLARWVMVYALRSYPAARPDAASRAVPLALATAVAGAVLVPLTVFSPVPVRIAVAVSLGMLAGLIALELLAACFRGITDATTGAAVELTELAVLWAFLPWGG
jgi:adenosylcobinamide-GDP ribazoletransferase